MNHRTEENHRIARKAVELEPKYPTLYQAVLAAAAELKIAVGHARATQIYVIAAHIRDRRNGKPK